jgi:LacI family transcriptional regulator
MLKLLVGGELRLQKQGAGGNMAGKVSMSSIADKLGISKNTVSLALRGIPGISENTRKLIIKTAEELGYQYKAAGKQEESARSLCLVIPKSAQNSIDFFSFIQVGVEDEAKKNHMNTILHYYDENDSEFQTPLCIREGMISGIITIGRVSERSVQALITYGLPIIMVDNYFDDLEIDCILTDNHCGGYIAAEYLLAGGHKRVGFFGDIKASISFFDRYMGYLKALGNHKIKNRQEYEIFCNYLETTAYEETVKRLLELGSQNNLPTAFVCCNDAGAIVLYKILKQLNILIPEQVSVVGFDDIAAASDIMPELTTMQVKKELMGRKAVLKLMQKLTDHNGIPEKLVLSATLVERNSVKKLKS